MSDMEIAKLKNCLHNGDKEINRLLDKIKALEAERDTLKARAEEQDETHRMQLVAISVAAGCNTRQSAAEQRIEKDNPYWTIAYSDACAAVDREMDERARAQAAEARAAAVEGAAREFSEAEQGIAWTASEQGVLEVERFHAASKTLDALLSPAEPQAKEEEA